MNLGVIGLPRSGKTTVFNALTGQRRPTGAYGAPGKLEVAVGVVAVPDDRVDRLSAMFRPRKTVHATVTFTDIAGLEEGIGAGGVSGPLRNELTKVDGFVHVARAFEDAAVAHPSGSVDPVRDAARLESELVLLDLVTADQRLEKLRDDWAKARGDVRQRNETEAALMDRLRLHLEAEKPLRELDDLTAAERKAIRGYGFLSLKPVLVLANLADDADETDARPVLPSKAGRVCTAMRGRVEADIAHLDPQDREAFLEAYGIRETGASRVIRLAYSLVGLRPFFTVGQDEVRAWTVPTGASAVEAAGAIHTDLAKGFIRAEVIACDDLVRLGGLKEAQLAGRQRLEGRDYVVRDGDVMTIRSGV